MCRQAAAYTNNKEGTIPTGVILSVAGPAVIGIIVVGALVFVNARISAM
jgi:hypothetical protein